ncbi:MAG: HNH endonuclease [Planctomycetota bacterium]|nr:HNH endonuclease [Planctomycetota bacterium]
MNGAVLNQPTLVLNKHWVAVQTTTVRRALGLLYTGRAQAVLPETYEVFDFDSWTDRDELPVEGIRTVNLYFCIPEVILLGAYDRTPRWRIHFSRKNLFRRDEFTCQYCGIRPGGNALTIDHVVPRSRGGATSWTNCVVACVRCNKRKGDRRPEDVGLSLRNRPVKPNWNPGVTFTSGIRQEKWGRFLPGCSFPDKGGDL